MRHLTVYKRFFTQSDCYKASATSRFAGVQVHSTGANNPYLRRYVQPDDGRLGLNTNGNSHNRPGVDVCANAYIGKLMDGTVAVMDRSELSARGTGGTSSAFGLSASGGKGGTKSGSRGTGGAGGSGIVILRGTEDDMLPIIFNGTQISQLIYNGTTIQHLIYNGQQLY